MIHLTEKDGVQYLLVFIPGQEPKSATDSHPNFNKIIDALRADPTDASALDLFDIPKTVQERFESLSERVSVRDGKMYLDGVEVHNALADQVVRFLYDGVDDWQPLVRFYENLLSNPLEHSREQLYEWLNQHSFVITDDGCLLGYKAVYGNSDPETGEIVGRSAHSGYAIVDGVEQENDYVHYRIGSVVTMPRDRVQHDPAVGCSYGLHVGTYNYASTFLGSSGFVVTVKVNPRDVVSVPTECSWAKLRCCRLEVLEINEGEYQSPLAYYSPNSEADELPRLIPASEYQRLAAHDLREDDGETCECDEPVDECDQETCECGEPVDECDQCSLCGSCYCEGECDEPDESCANCGSYYCGGYCTNDEW